MQLEDLKQHLVRIERSASNSLSEVRKYYSNVETKVDALSKRVIMTPVTALLYGFSLLLAVAFGVWIG